ncbi:hypothetical protein [Devosia sp. 2618]|uniref:hypothetical protein n=1 Tax=Devosia sp. 2618 TaxID=3156454 RepID=UPI003393C7A6
MRLLTRSLALTALIAAGLSAPAVMAQQVSDFAGCTGISNDIERLVCFDRVAAPLAKDGAEAAACVPMTVEDLKLDYTELLGTCAEVSGTVIQAADIVMLMQSMMDANPFYVDISGLTRDERKILLNCPTGCQLTVTGTVQETNYSKGMKAASIRQ